MLCLVTAPSFGFLLLCWVGGVLCSPKRGLAVAPYSYMCNDFKAFPNITWWYDWSQNFWYYHAHTHCNMDNFTSSHIPMIWGWRPHKDVPFGISSRSDFILGFNEPNHRSQSNLTPQEAAIHWRELEKHTYGLPLVSPAAAPCHTSSKCHGDAEDWFDKFFQSCSGCKVDYLATHMYTCNADHVMSYLKRLYDRFGKKIWLTEFACPYTNSYSRQLHFMQALLPRLEAAPYVFRYAWNKARVPREGSNSVTHTASLLHSNTSTLTSLGHFYTSTTINKILAVQQLLDEQNVTPICKPTKES